VNGASGLLELTAVADSSVGPTAVEVRSPWQAATTIAAGAAYTRVRARIFSIHW
jgi:hypothetical protein